MEETLPPPESSNFQTMQKIIYLLFIFSILFIVSCKPVVEQERGIFKNPIIAGFYPDPSICKSGDDYYLVNSSFSFFPGIPIFHSKDLVNWNQIGNVMDRPEQMNLNDLRISQGLYAPTIRYHDGVFYIICTLVGGINNFVVTATDPAGPWSNPTPLPYIDGMGPDIFFDNNGKAYVTSCASPDTLHYRGHRAIKMYEFFKDSLTTSKTSVTLVNGGPDIKKQPIWIEAPHIFVKDGFYYLICAEGGTSIDHSEVVFRSKHAEGPYESFPGNPILTQRHLDENRPNAISNAGHADFVETKNGEWFSVFLACRPYEKNYFNTGRETFMAPVKWKNDWPLINPGFEKVQYEYPKPQLAEVDLSDYPLNGNFTIRDQFLSEAFAPHWLFIRNPSGNKVTVDTIRQCLELKLAPEMLNQKTNPAFLGRRQQHLNFAASVKLDFHPQNENEMAGLVAFQNEAYYYFLAKTLVENKEAVVLFKSKKIQDEFFSEIIAVAHLGTHDNLFLKITGSKQFYSFYFATTENQWNELLINADGKYLSTEVAKGFIGTILGMYASANGTTSENAACFDWFEYSGEDGTFESPVN